MTDDWTKEWERRIVNGVYPLRRYLGRSNHSVVFLTECAAQNVSQAAIKILPANPVMAQAQLGHWKRVAALSHPHLIRLLDAGRCQLGGHNFLFVVMDYAEQNLAQILPARPLTADEVRELLPPTLDALTYLHGKNLVQGGLKPPNFLVVGDQLKLASDTIRPAGERTASTAKPSLYDPPEAKKSRIPTAGDLWGLGITLIEALTQVPPAWSREPFEEVPLPANLAPEFVDTIHRCLNRDPDQRPAIAELVAQFSPLAAHPPVTPAPLTAAAAPPAMNEPLIQTPSPQEAPEHGLPGRAIALGLITLGVVWTGVHLFHAHSNVKQAASITAPPPVVVPPGAPPPAVQPPVAQPPVAPRPVAPRPVAQPAALQDPQAADAAAPAVLHQELPDISSSARQSIRGIIKIAVRVSVDRTGTVVATALANRAASKYFTRTVLEAAKKWQFSQTPSPASRSWLLHFELTRAGATAHAEALR